MLWRATRRVDGVSATRCRRDAVDAPVRASRGGFALSRQFRDGLDSAQDEDDWNEFNDINKIVKGPICDSMN